MFDSSGAANSMTAQSIAPAEAAVRSDWQGVGKRLFDMVIAGAALIVLSPAFLIIAIAVRLDTPGPIFFRQRRTGLNGKVFRIFKFRSMSVVEDGDTIRHATSNDPRVTRVGDFLRKSSLDEMPQLLNVILGDMSLVGPRPHALSHDVHYGALLPEYGLRFAVRPGLTGLAQIKGLRGEIHQLDCMARRITADVEYVRTWSVARDFIILLQTVPMILRRVNAY